MPAILTLHTQPALSAGSRRRYTAKGGGIEQIRFSIGRTEVTQVDLGLPFGLPEKIWQKKCREVLALMAGEGIRYALLPAYLQAQGRAYGLLPCEALPALRRLASDAVLDRLGKCAEGAHVHIFARMPSREVMDCIRALAERCRYVSVSGGDWAKGAERMLLRDYGAAPPGNRDGLWVTAAFDSGYRPVGRECILDLTREGLRGPDVVHPRLGAAYGLQGLPHGRFYDAGPLLGHLYIHGGLSRQDIRVWCK